DTAGNSSPPFRPRPPPFALRAVSGSWAPRCMRAAGAPKGPVRGRGTPIRIGSLLCADRMAGKASVAAPRVVVDRNDRRSIRDLLVRGGSGGRTRESPRPRAMIGVARRACQWRGGRGAGAKRLLLGALRLSLGLLRRGGGLLGRGTGALDQLDGRLAPLGGRALREALLQRFHQVDDLGALHLGADRRDLLALDLAVDHVEDAQPVVVLVVLGLELVVGELVDETRREVDLAVPDLRRLALVDLAEVAHLVGEVHRVQ